MRLEMWPHDQVLVVIVSRRREGVRKRGAGVREGAEMRGTEDLGVKDVIKAGTETRVLPK